MEPSGPERGGGAPPGDRIGAEFYDRSEYFGSSSRHLQNPRSSFQRYRIEKILQLHRPGKEARVLDLGCGWGTVTFAVAPMVRSVVGVDFSERSIEFCRGRAAEEGAVDVEFVRADAADTGLEPESFDVLYAADLLEHLYPDQTAAVLDECERLLKRGGRLAIWTPNPGHFLEKLRNDTILLRSDPTHVDYMTMERIHGDVRARGFSIEKAYYAESHVPVLDAVERNLMASVPLFRRRIAVLARKR